MNTRKTLVSILMLVSLLLSACTPAATATPPSPTVAPPTQVADTASPVPTPLSGFPGVGKVLEKVPLPGYPDRDSVYAFDSLWLLNDVDGTVTRWETINRQVLATITVGDPGKAPYGDPVSAVATADSIWVTSVAAREIVRIDPSTNQIAEHIPLGQVDGKDFVTNVMIGDDNNLWVWDYDRNITLKIDLKTKQVMGMPNVNPATVVDGTLWGWDSRHSRDAAHLLRIDPANDQVIAKIPVVSVNDQNASNENSIWLGHGHDVLRIDPQTNQLIASIDLGTTAMSVKFINGNVWVTASPVPPACHDVNQSLLARIDPATNTIVGKIGLDCPVDIFGIENTIWVYAVREESNDFALNAVLIQPEP